jgi:quercetin dioxygenase-like cupin family protein
MTIEKLYCHVTGFGHDGKARFIQSGEVAPIEVAFQAGTKFYRLWGTADEGAVVGCDLAPVFEPFFPSGHGTRWQIVRFPPQGTGEAFVGGLNPGDVEALRRDAEEKLPGLFSVHATAEGSSASHATDSIDYAMVLEGQLHLSLDSGEEVVLEPGHFVVQRGARHTWSNQTDKPAMMVGVTVAAKRVL